MQKHQGKKKLNVFLSKKTITWTDVSYLHESACLLTELVVMFELNSNGLVTVQACQLHICGVTHEEGAIEICCSDP